MFSVARGEDLVLVGADRGLRQNQAPLAGEGGDDAVRRLAGGGAPVAPSDCPFPWMTALSCQAATGEPTGGARRDRGLVHCPRQRPGPLPRRDRSDTIESSSYDARRRCGRRLRGRTGCVRLLQAAALAAARYALCNHAWSRGRPHPEMPQMVVSAPGPIHRTRMLSLLQSQGLARLTDARQLPFAGRANRALVVSNDHPPAVHAARRNDTHHNVAAAA